MENRHASGLVICSDQHQSALVGQGEFDGCRGDLVEGVNAPDDPLQICSVSAAVGLFRLDQKKEAAGVAGELGECECSDLGQLGRGLGIADVTGREQSQYGLVGGRVEIGERLRVPGDAEAGTAELLFERVSAPSLAPTTAIHTRVVLADETPRPGAGHLRGDAPILAPGGGVG